MKKCIALALAITLFVLNGSSQDKFYFYFIEFRNTGKGEVELKPENQVFYPDIDKLLVSSRVTNKRGVEEITGRRYASYTEAFNTLSGEGLEFVGFANLGSFGGATAAIAGDVRVNYMIWRKKRPN